MKLGSVIPNKGVIKNVYLSCEAAQFGGVQDTNS